MIICSCIVLVYTKVHFASYSHKTEKGAEIAMEFHKENERKEHECTLIYLFLKIRIICRVWK
jgi:hypothetical protein